MQLVVLASKDLQEELLSHGTIGEIEITWIKNFTGFAKYPEADAFIHLLFENDPQEIEMLKSISSKPVIVNAPERKTEESFIRINAWPGFLKRNVLEGYAAYEWQRSFAEKIFAHFQKKMKWLPDEPGFVSARIISTIINEAYFALEEGVSTKDEIDKAMKLGTNYPMGPFEWCRSIGIKKVFTLLSELSAINSRYQPARLFQKEAFE